MALLAPLVWEISPTNGDVLNGGAFDPTSGFPGTDYSRSNTPIRSWTAAETIYTNNLASTQASGWLVLTSASYNFADVDVGNIINITAGANFTAGRYQIISVALNAATLDRACGVVGNAFGGTGYEGGAVETIDTIYGTIVAGNTVYMKYHVDGDAITAARTTTSGTIATPIRIIGYYLSRTDLTGQTWGQSHTDSGFLTLTNYPVVNLGANLLTLGTCTDVYCISFTSTRNGVALTTGQNSVLWRVKSTDSGDAANASAVTTGVRSSCIDCEFSTTGATNSGVVVTAGTTSFFHACKITSTVGPGLSTSTGLTMSHCLFYDIAAGVVAATVAAANLMQVFINCTWDNCGTALTNPNAAATSQQTILVNPLVTNCATGFNNLRSGTQVIPIYIFNQRARDNVALYTANTWLNNPVSGTPGINDLLTDSDNGTEYWDATVDNYRPRPASLARKYGIPVSMDCGAFQEYPSGVTRSRPLRSSGRSS